MQTNTHQEKNRGYIRFISGQIISLLGSEIVAFVLGIYLARTYKNAFYFAISMILQFLPRVIISPIAGVWADKRNRKRIVISSDMMQAIITTTLVILFNLNNIYSWAFWTFGEIYILFGFILLRAIFQAVQGPSVSSILPTIVPAEKLSRLNGFFQFANGLMGLIAPIFAGFLISLWKVYNLLWIDAATFLIALIFIASVKIPESPKTKIITDSPRQETKFKKFINNLSEGIHVSKEIEGLAALLAVFVITNVFVSPVNTLSDILLLVTHSGSNLEYVIVSVSFAAGMIVGSIVAASVKEWKRPSSTLLIGIIGLFIGLFIVGFTPVGIPGSLDIMIKGEMYSVRGSFFLIAVGGFITTFGLPLFSTIAVTMIQLTVPLDKMGRFSGFMSALISMITPIAYLLSGYLGQILNIRYVIMGASVLAITIIIFMWLFSQISKLEPIVKKKLALAKQQTLHKMPSTEDTQIESNEA